MTFPEWNRAYEVGHANGTVTGFMWGVGAGILVGTAMVAGFLAVVGS